MNELVYLKNDEAVCSSLLVAEKFEKRHADVRKRRMSNFDSWFYGSKSK